MGRISADEILDLKETLEEIRGLENLKEKSPAVFYYKTTPFFHFHTKDGKRWADVKSPDGWQSIVIPFESTKDSRAKFLVAVKKAHQVFAKK